jgi:hypothetical protein
MILERPALRPIAAPVYSPPDSSLARKAPDRAHAAS